MKRSASPSTSSFYGSRQWRALSAECIRNQPTCTAPGCAEPSTVADHIVQRSRGGSDDLSNLRGLCARHHNQRRRGGEPRAIGCDERGIPHGGWPTRR
jgi:5-methylcytosine-specific restriction endonuclease McrA